MRLLVCLLFLGLCACHGRIGRGLHALHDDGRLTINVYCGCKPEPCNGK